MKWEMNKTEFLKDSAKSKKSLNYGSKHVLEMYTEGKHLKTVVISKKIYES